MSHKSVALKYRTFWLSIGWLLIAAVVYFSLTPSPPSSMELVSDKLHHVFAYFVLMFWFAQIYVSRRSHYYLAVAFIALGILLELAQYLSSIRNGEVIDVVFNTIGVSAALYLARMGMVECLLWVEKRVSS